MQLRKIIKTRGRFPNDEAGITLLWRALRNVLAKSVRATFDWRTAINSLLCCLASDLPWHMDNVLQIVSHTKMRTGSRDDWKAAMNAFAILYEDRFTRYHL
jgi:putative transposase